MKEKEGKWVVRTWKGLTLFVLNEHMNDIVKIILCMYFIYGAYVINIDDKKSKVTIEFHYLLTKKQLHTLILLELKILFHKIGDKSISYNIFRMQDNESIMCGFYRIAFIIYMLARNNLLD